MRFIVSTIGTSILTNSIDGANPEETENWRRILGISANYKEAELSEEHKTVIDTLAERAREKLGQNDVGIHRRASAELNGIYGIYEGTLPENTNDQHYLIYTDTYQGLTTGNLIKDFLSEQGFDVAIEIPEELSAKDTESFTVGIKVLIKWLEENVPSQRDSGYQVIFNLVGGFKSLQGYMQTFGTFYADESVYIFERSSDLIKIPRLPIKIDTSEIERYRGQFALMDASAPVLINEVTGFNDILETLTETMIENGNTYVGLSEWGQLIWNRARADLLKTDVILVQNELSALAKAQLTLMDAGKMYPRDELDRNIPEVLIENSGAGPHAKLSVWGKLVWEQAKEGVFRGSLLRFPRLQYQNDFIDDFENQNTNDQRCKLQETLAKVAYLLDKHSGNTAILTADGGLQYERYSNVPGDIDHFRVNGGRRVSCRAQGGNLILRHCGAHDYVNNNP